MLRYLIMYLYKKKTGKKFDLKIARYRGLPYSGWTYQSETTLLSCLNCPLRISTATEIRNVTTRAAGETTLICRCLAMLTSNLSIDDRRSLSVHNKKRKRSTEWIIIKSRFRLKCPFGICTLAWNSVDIREKKCVDSSGKVIRCR